MLVTLLLSFTPVILGRTRGGARVVDLHGEPGFKSVALAWNMEDTNNWDRRVRLSFCENQVVVNLLLVWTESTAIFFKILVLYQRYHCTLLSSYIRSGGSTIATARQ